MRETAGSIVVLGLCAAWLEYFVPEGRLKSAVSFSLGLILTFFLLQCVSTAAQTLRLPSVSLEKTQSVTVDDGIVSALVGTRCRVQTDGTGNVVRIEVTSQEESPVQRIRIRTLLCRIYSVEEERIVFSGR